MSFFAQPVTNLHSPTAIGDVTPNTAAFTVTTLGGNVTFSADLAYDIGALGANRPRAIYCGDITCGSVTAANAVSSSSVVTSSNNVAGSGGLYSFGLGFRGQGAFVSLSDGAVKFTNDARNAFGSLQAKLTTDTNATTGLIAGALSALTTASIVLYDASGQAYRVPCVI